MAEPASDRTPVRPFFAVRLRHPENGLLFSLAAALIFAGIAAALDFRKYVVFVIGGDTANYTQELWNTIHGRILAKTSIYVLQDPLRGGHVAPILLLLALPFKLFPDPRTLLVAQVCAVALGGVLTYLLSRVHQHGQFVSAGIVLFYLLYPIVHYATINDFHTDPLAVPAVLGALLAFDTRRWRLLALCLALILLTKEQMVLVVGGLGVYWWAFRGNARVGRAAIAAAVVYGLAVLVPWYLATSSQFTQEYSTYYGNLHQAWDGAPATLSGLGARLMRVAHLLSQPFRFQNVFWALLPSGFLFLLDGSAMVLLLPLVGLYISDPMTNYFFYHHYIITVPFVVYGLLRTLNRPWLKRRAHLVVPVLVLWVAALDYSYATAPLNLMHFLHQPALLATTDRTRAQEALLQGIPAGAIVDADYPLAAHLATRRYLFQLQSPPTAALSEYVLLDLHTDLVHPPAWMVIMDRQTLAFVQHAGGFRVWRSVPRYGLVVYANCRHFPQALGCAR